MTNRKTAYNNAFTPGGLIGWQCRAWLRNDTPLHCQKNNLSLHETRPA
jgi:hypothetical protein